MKALLAFTLALGGCATVADLRTSAPFMRLETAKGVQEVGSCVAQQWSARSGSTNTAPRPAGLTLTLSYVVYSNTLTAAAVDVDDRGSSRTVSVYARKGDANDKLRREISACV